MQANLLVHWLGEVTHLLTPGHVRATIGGPDSTSSELCRQKVRSGLHEFTMSELFYCVGASRVPRAASGLATTYLIAYNFLSKCGWAYILYLAVRHLLAPSPVLIAKSSASAAVSSVVQKALAYLPSTLRNATPLSQQAKAKVWEYIPASLLPYVSRAKTFYAVAGPEVAFVQSFAILEVVHVILALVPSPLVTTAMQVASRLWIVWGVVEQCPEVRTQTHSVPFPMTHVGILGLDRRTPIHYTRAW